MEMEDPKSVLEKVAEAEAADSQKWYRSMWFRIVRIPLVGLLFLVGVVFFLIFTVIVGWLALTCRRAASTPDETNS